MFWFSWYSLSLFTPIVFTTPSSVSLLSLGIIDDGDDESFLASVLVENSSLGFSRNIFISLTCRFVSNISSSSIVFPLSICVYNLLIRFKISLWGGVLVALDIRGFRFSLDGISIRRCGIEDIGGVIGVNRRTLPENYSTSLFLAMLRRFRDIFFVAVDISQDSIIGYCMNKLEYNTKSFFAAKKVTKGHVFSIGVLHEYRRRGIASALMVVSLKHMFMLGASEIFLEVRVSNTPAQNLYNKFGFEVVMRVPRYYADGEDAYVMAVPRERIESLIDELYLRLRELGVLEE